MIAVNNVAEERDIKLDIILGKYKAISAYKIPKDFNTWKKCRNCGLRPLTWCYDNVGQLLVDVVIMNIINSLFIQNQLCHTFQEIKVLY